jgi:glutamate decarboxylase
MSADYLFMPDKLYDVQYDTGDKVIQCGRHNDIFKLWLQWRSKVFFLLKKYTFVEVATF